MRALIFLPIIGLVVLIIPTVQTVRFYREGYKMDAAMFALGIACAAIINIIALILNFSH